MENNELSNRVFKRLEEKIAIEEFRIKEIKNTKENHIKKPHTFLKVASFLIITSILAGNAYTYATYEKNLFSYVLGKIGITEEYLVNVEQEKQSNDINLVLENYAIDNETLIVGYRLKLNENIDYFLEYLMENTMIIYDGKEYRIESYDSTFEKISDTEYEVFKFYSFDTEKISSNAKFKTNLKLYKEYQGTIEDKLGEWDFAINLEEKQDSNNKQYLVENKSVELENLETSEIEWNDETPISSVKLLEITKSDMITKLMLYMDFGYTDVEYSVEVEYEDGTTILEDNIQTIKNGFVQEIILGEIDFNSKIRINIYGRRGIESGEIILSSKGTIEVDLKNDLIEKEIEEILCENGEWYDLCFTYDKTIDIEKSEYDEYSWINFNFYKTVGNEKFNTGNFYIIRYQNNMNQDVIQVAESRMQLEKMPDFSNYLKNEYSIYMYDDVWNGNEIKLSFEQVMELAKNKELMIDGKILNENNIAFQDVNFEDVREIKINDIDIVTWKTKYGEELSNTSYIFIHNGYIYEIYEPHDIQNNEEIMKVINSIKTKS